MQVGVTEWASCRDERWVSIPDMMPLCLIDEESLWLDSDLCISSLLQELTFLFFLGLESLFPTGNEMFPVWIQFPVWESVLISLYLL